jgi:mxaK protein
MRRRVLHAVFAAAVLCCAAWAGFEGWRLLDAQRSNVDVIRAGAASDVAVKSPRVRLAQAVALSKAGQRDAAAKLYDGLITSADLDEIGQAALFDLANMYLREAIAAGGRNPIASTPLVELAKNRYRELLRAKPDDWDARYNLERALWLQPESAQAFDDGREPYEVRRMIKVPDVALGDLP